MTRGVLGRSGRGAVATMKSPPSPVGGRRAHRKQVTRRELLAAGRTLFGDKGLYESRIEDLARYAGVAKGTLYGYFANKAELIEAVVSSGFDDLMEHVHREARGADSQADLVRRVVNAHLSFFEANPDLLRIFHQVRGLLKFKRPEGALVTPIVANYLAGLARVLAPSSRGSRRGGRPPLATATLLFGAVSGIVSTHASLPGVGPRRFPAQAASRAVVALVDEFDKKGRARRAV